MHGQWFSGACFSVCLIWCSAVAAADMDIRNQLHLLPQQDLSTILPPETHLLLEPSSIESLIDQLDG